MIMSRLSIEDVVSRSIFTCRGGLHHADGCEALVEKHACKQSPSRIEELVEIFVHATNVRWIIYTSLSGDAAADFLADGNWVLGDGIHRLKELEHIFQSLSS